MHSRTVPSDTMDWVGTRYGDPLLPVADLESIARAQCLLKPGGPSVAPYIWTVSLNSCIVRMEGDRIINHNPSKESVES